MGNAHPSEVANSPPACLPVKVASLGQITDALFNVGGQYRRNM